jgi:hypothetical protein
VKPKEWDSWNPSLRRLKFWKGCKPNFVFPAETLGRESFVSAASTRNPFRCAELETGSFRVPYLALHPMGFSMPPRLRLERWALTPPFHPYRLIPGPDPGLTAVFSLWHYPSVRPYGITSRVYLVNPT